MNVLGCVSQRYKTQIIYKQIKKILIKNFENQLNCIVYIFLAHKNSDKSDYSIRQFGISFHLLRVLMKWCSCCFPRNEFCRLKFFAKPPSFCYENFILICSSKIPRKKKRNAHAQTQSLQNVNRAKREKNAKEAKENQTQFGS